MKKTAAILLALTLALSMSACNAGQDIHDKETTPPSQEATQPTTDPNTPAEELLASSAYYRVVRQGDRYRYWVYDQSGGNVLSEDSELPVEISMIDSYLVDVKIGDRHENTTHRYYHLLKDQVTPAYSYVIAASDTYVAYLDGTLDDRTVVISSMFDPSFRKETSLKMLSSPMPVFQADISHGNLYLLYNVPTDSYTFSHIHFSDEEYRYFESYDNILLLIKALYDLVPYCGWIDNPELHFGTNEPREQALLSELLTAIFTTTRAVGNQRHKLGYALKDLNEDGTSELLLLRDDFELLAILTTVNGAPTLLKSARNRVHCALDEKGQIHVVGSSGADVTAYQIYRLLPDSGDLELLLEHGLDGHEWIDGVAVTKYYQLVNGEKVYISREESDALASPFPYPGTEGNKLLLEDAYTPLEKEPQPEGLLPLTEATRLAKEYWSHFEIEKNGYIVAQAHNPDAPDSVYVFVIKWRVMDHYSTLDEIWIDRHTGEAIIPYDCEK